MGEKMLACMVFLGTDARNQKGHFDRCTQRTFGQQMRARYEANSGCAQPTSWMHAAPLIKTKTKQRQIKANPWVWIGPHIREGFVRLYVRMTLHRLGRVICWHGSRLRCGSIYVSSKFLLWTVRSVYLLFAYPSLDAQQIANSGEVPPAIRLHKGATILGHKARRQEIDWARASARFLHRTSIMPVCTCMYIFLYVHIYTYTHIYTYIHTYTYIYI